MIKGSAASAEIDVQHVVVQGSVTAMSGEAPALSETVFSVGAKLIVSAMATDAGAWRSLDERHGALSYSDETVSKIRSLGIFRS